MSTIDEGPIRRSAARHGDPHVLNIVLGENRPYPVREMSAGGLSFICPRSEMSFQTGQTLDDFEVVRTRGGAVMKASGEIVHVTPYDSEHAAVGVRLVNRRFVHRLKGHIRATRRVPNQPIDVLLELGEDAVGWTGSLIDFTPASARIVLHLGDSDRVQTGARGRMVLRTGTEVVSEIDVEVLQKRSDRAEVVVSFGKDRLDLPFIEAEAHIKANTRQLSRLLARDAEYSHLAPAFKALICDWRMYLHRIQKYLDTEQRKPYLRKETAQVRLVKDIEAGAISTMNRYIDSLNALAEDIPAEYARLYKEYFRENLNPYLRASNLVARMIDRDRGYAGDFQTVKTFFEDPYTGSTLFSRLMNRVAMDMESVRAHQDRIDYLTRELVRRKRETPGGFRFLSFGSGPAEEVFRFIETADAGPPPVEGTLVDLDGHALVEVADRFVETDTDHNVSLQLVNGDVLDIIRGRERAQIQGHYDFVYCAGLLDYFRESLARRIIRYLVQLTRPGGAVVVTNVSRENRTRHIMEFCGGWEVIHRDADELKRLVDPELPVAFAFDPTRANIYAVIDVPNRPLDEAQEETLTV